MACGIQASQREWLVGGWVGGSGVRVCVCLCLCGCLCVSLCVCEVLWKPCVRQDLSAHFGQVLAPISCGGSATETGGLWLGGPREPCEVRVWAQGWQVVRSSECMSGG